MDHLVCYLPGAIALGVTGGLTEAEARKQPGWGRTQEQRMRLARELMKTCWGMYRVTKTGLAPEIVWFETHNDALSPFPRSASLPGSWNSKAMWEHDYVVKAFDAHNLQRPETVESLFMMWRITNNPIYRRWGWEIFCAFQKHTALEDGEGHSSLNSVKYIPSPRRDNMESFWLVSTPEDIIVARECAANELHQTGRDTKVSISVILANGFSTAQGYRIQHRRAYFP
jgi:mannosyl-oligosaccharide alpha-1,2-mannosidase